MSFWPFFGNKKNNNNKDIPVPPQKQEKKFEQELEKSYANESSAPKLTSAEQLQVVRLIGCFWKDMEIVQYIKDVMGKRLSQPSIHGYRTSEKWKLLIDKYREEYNRQTFDVPIANKRKRLDELQKLYDIHLQADNYTKAQSILRDAKDEMQERVADVSFHFTQVNNTQFKQMTDEELTREKIRTLDEYEKVKRIIKQGETRLEKAKALEDEATEITEELN